MESWPGINVKMNMRCRRQLPGVILAQLEALAAKEEEPLNDAWEHPMWFVVIKEGDPSAVCIVSAGEDGLPRTADDIMTDVMPDWRSHAASREPKESAPDKPAEQ